MITKELLFETIKSAAKEWVYDSKTFVSYWDINSGSCNEFAFYVLERLPQNSGVTVVSTGQVLDQKGIESYGESGEFSNHVWLAFNGECFDIERPNGVKHFLDLPYFQREIKEKKMGLKDRDLYFLLTENPEKYPTLIYDADSYAY